MGVIFLYLLGIFSEMDRDNIVSNCKMGMRQRDIDGLWNGGKMFGYISNKNKELEILHEHSNIVKEIFNLYVNKKWDIKR